MIAGILYPASNAHPSIGIEFMAGIRTCLQTNRLQDTVKLVVENGGFAGVEKEVKDKVEKLLVAENIDILILYLDQKILTLLKPLLNAWGKPVIVVNPGADYPQSWEVQDNIFHLSLNHAFLCWLTGADAAMNKINPAGVMATSFYDCGYLHSAMMVCNYNLKGGTIAFNYVNNQPYKEGFHINELMGYLQSDRSAKQVLCIYDEWPAAHVYDELSKMPGAESLELFVSPMMLEKKSLVNVAEKNTFSISGYKPWEPSSESDANRFFTETINRVTGKPTSLFSLLGWEAALVLMKIITQENYFKNKKELLQDPGVLTIDSPRGKLILDPSTHWFTAPVIKLQIKNAGMTVTEMSADDIQPEWKNFVANPPKGVVSGWTNTYLCY